MWVTLKLRVQHVSCTVYSQPPQRMINVEWTLHMKYAFAENKDITKTPVFLLIRSRGCAWILRQDLQSHKETKNVNKGCAESSLHPMASWSKGRWSCVPESSGWMKRPTAFHWDKSKKNTQIDPLKTWFKMCRGLCLVNVIFQHNTVNKKYP